MTTQDLQIGLSILHTLKKQQWREGITRAELLSHLTNNKLYTNLIKEATRKYQSVTNRSAPQLTILDVLNAMKSTEPYEELLEEVANCQTTTKAAKQLLKWGIDKESVEELLLDFDESHMDSYLDI